MTDDTTVRRFHEAILQTDLSALGRFLASEPDLIHSKNEEGDGVLHLAEKVYEEEPFGYLLSQGADPNSRDRGGQTPLHIACIGHFWRADSLLSSGADINAKDDTGNTPLHIAAMFLSGRCLEFLLEQGAEIEALNDKGYSPLHQAIAGDGNIGTARYLWERGANRDIFGATGIGKIGFARRMLREDSGLANARDGDGLTPLHWAVMRSQRAIANLLLKHGGDVNARDNSGDTPLHKACHPTFWGANPGLEDLLLGHGADVRAVNCRGQSPLHGAAWRQKLEVFDTLVALGADANAPDSEGKTPLDIAREQKGSPRFVPGMLYHGPL